MAALTPLQSITLNSSQSTVTFSNIDQTYTDLRLVVSPFSSVNGMNYSCQVGNMSANGGVDTGSNYSFTNFRSGPSGSAAAAGRSSNLTFFNNLNQGVHTTYPHVYKYDFMNYSNSTQYKNLLCRFDENDGGSGYLAMSTGTWRSTNPINTITLTAISGTFTAGSTFSLYGIRAGGTAKASGGDIVVSDGTYWYHAFLKTGVFTPAIYGLSCDILIVGGGGGGAGGGYVAANGGGGGAGGLLGYSSQSLTTASYSVTVGAGGSAGAGGNNAPIIAATNGGNSSFIGRGVSYVAIGGGRGGTFGNYDAGSGGSGGGGADNATSRYLGGSPTSGQGYAGANGSSYQGASGGGGGAGGAGSGSTPGIGATYNTSVGGSSGPYSFIDAMGSATGTGQYSSSHYYYAGGGAGSYLSLIHI